MNKENIIVFFVLTSMLEIQHGLSCFNGNGIGKLKQLSRVVHSYNKPFVNIKNWNIFWVKLKFVIVENALEKISKSSNIVWNQTNKKLIKQKLLMCERGFKKISIIYNIVRNQTNTKMNVTGNNWN